MLFVQKHSSAVIPNPRLFKHSAEVNRLHVLVPVLFGDFVQAAEHDGKDLIDVLFDEAEDVLVIPKVQRTFCYLRVQTGSTAAIKVKPTQNQTN